MEIGLYSTSITTNKTFKSLKRNLDGYDTVLMVKPSSKGFKLVIRFEQKFWRVNKWENVLEKFWRESER